MQLSNTKPQLQTSSYCSVTAAASHS